MTSRDTDGLSLDQAPPLSVVFPFFGLASIAIVVAGAVVAAEGRAVLLEPLMPATLGLTHIVTLGFLLTTMMGALYQMIPVVIGVRVPGIPLAHVVWLGSAVGLFSLAVGLGTATPVLVSRAVWFLGPTLALFLVPTGWAVFRAPILTETAHGIRYALLCLLGAVFLGVWMARGHMGASFPGDRWLFIRAHFALALLGWVGSLIVAVSWQVVPMFYLARETPVWQRRVILGALVLGTAPLPVLPWLDPSWANVLVVWSPAPAVFALFVLHPIVSLVGIRRRRRKRAHASLVFWKAGLCTAPLVAIAGLLAALLDAPRWDLLHGFLALWAWAGVIVHGMLSRIVPFLVWFHRFSPLAGIVPIPSMNDLLPQRWTQVALALHLASVAAGVAAILTRVDLVVRAAGVLVALTGLALAAMIVHVTRQRPAPASA
ncbi:MAG: hypothetical protein KC619_07045 [Myxococcales bacterium]|nr:hypothetical protein [Myxococcales bacterium]